MIEKYLNKVTQADCLDVLKDLPDKCVDLVLTDPPYNIGKDHWDKIDNYVEWLGSVFKECERVLKDNGSFYFFHNDFLQIVEIQNWINENTDFRFKQFIIWNKRFSNAKNKGFLDGFIEVEHLRNYQRMAEYCLYYVKIEKTLWDITGWETVKLDVNNFKPLRQYFKEFQEDVGWTKKAIIDRVGQKADHCFRWGSTQWDLPTKETYEELLTLPKTNGFLRREYEDLRREYEDLRREYEDLRYTFNNQKTHHSVWEYEVEKQNGHITPKPVELIKNIMLHSSNENDLILDCFGGSGTTAVASIRTGRSFILTERESKYCDIANKRIQDELAQFKLAL